MVQSLFDQHNTGYDDRMSLDDAYKIFETIYKKINFTKKGE